MKTEEYLATLKSALVRAETRGEGAVATKLKNAIDRLEATLAGAHDPVPAPVMHDEGHSTDNLLAVALRMHLPTTDDDPETEATVTTVIGLPLTFPVDPEDPNALRRLYRSWLDHLDADFKLHDRADPEGRFHRLGQLAVREGKSVAAKKRELVHWGLSTTLGQLDEDTEARIGSGEGSRKVRFVPATDHPLGVLAWIAQEAKAKARQFLDVLSDDPSEVEGEPLPESFPDDAPDPLEVLAYEEQRARHRTFLLAQASKREAETLNEYLDHYDETGDHREAIRRVAAARAARGERGAAENTVESAILGFQRRMKRLVASGVLTPPSD